MRRYPRDLNERHWEIIGLVAEGLSNLEIGKRLHLTEDTVKTHLRDIFRILEVRNRAQLVNVAYQRGILTVDPLDEPLPEPRHKQAPTAPQPTPRPASRAKRVLFERRGLIYWAVSR